jgi:hypothetical protein
MKHPGIEWNAAVSQWFCVRCLRTSDQALRSDAENELNLFRCSLRTQERYRTQPSLKVVELGPIATSFCEGCGMEFNSKEPIEEDALSDMKRAFEKHRCGCRVKKVA